MITDVSDVQDVANPLDKVESGLRTSADGPVPLKAVHIRGQLMDLAAQVCYIVSWQSKTLL